MGDEDPKREEQGALESLADQARARAARVTADAAVDAAGAAAARLANSVLDGLETLMFGAVGAAEAAAKKDEGDPLERLRETYAAPRPRPTEAPPPADPVARARAELDALKAARKAPSEPKKTL